MALALLFCRTVAFLAAASHLASAVVITSAVADDVDKEKAASAAEAAAAAAVNATEAWQRLLYNQAKYDRQLQHQAGGPGGGGGGIQLTDVPFEEQEYSRAEVLLRPGQMIELLGFSNYQPYYMRLEAPPQLQSSSAHSQSSFEEEPLSEPGAEPSLDELLQLSPHGNNRQQRHRGQQQQQRGRHHRLRFLRRQQRRKLRRYLLAYTACRVAPGWRDLGKAYWPRWLRQGECQQSPSGSCSIPPGMRCRPARHRRLFVLRYLCAKHWRRSQCRWVKQSVPVLDSCACKC